MMEAFNIRLDESKVIDLAFLHNCNVPTVAVLYEDTKEQRHIKTYEISMREKVSERRARRAQQKPICLLYVRTFFKAFPFLWSAGVHARSLDEN